MRSSQYARTTNSTGFRNNSVIITTDSDEEEKAINYEIESIRNEFTETEDKLKRLRWRLKRNYERLEKIQMRRVITQREREIRKELLQKWLPRLKYSQKRLIRMEQNVLNSISAPIQPEDEIERNRFFGPSSDDDDGILKFSANEILSSICGNGNGKDSLKNNEKSS